MNQSKLSPLRKKLLHIQKNLDTPKSQFNKHGGYYYRSMEDILEGLKPLLDEVILTIENDVTLVGNRYYFKATATIELDNESISKNGFAREDEMRKGSSQSQLSGSAASYATKRALGNLFLIDDTKDADTNEYHDENNNKNNKENQSKDNNKNLHSKEKYNALRGLRELIYNVTSGYKNRNLIENITKDLGLKDLRELNNCEQQVLVSMIDFIKHRYIKNNFR